MTPADVRARMPEPLCAVHGEAVLDHLNATAASPEVHSHFAAFRRGAHQLRLCAEDALRLAERNSTTKEASMADLTRKTPHVHFDGLGLNDRLIVTCDERDPDAGNASHHYNVHLDGEIVADVQFQHGPRNVEGSAPGILDTVLIDILLDRFRGFQSGPFASRENALVVTKLEEAHQWMRERAWARHRQNVLGKNEQHAQPA